MDLILIGEGKLKLTLSPDDMETYKLDAAALDWSDGATRKAVREILNEAKQRCGFDPAGERVVVQLFPSRAGGCEIFVTRLASGQRSDAGLSASRIRAACAELSATAYSFGTLDDLLRCCAALDAAGYSRPSAAYCRDDGGYLLIICGEWPAADEFGRRMDTGKAEIYIGEHTKKIRGRDAVGVLSALI